MKSDANVWIPYHPVMDLIMDAKSKAVKNEDYDTESILIKLEKEIRNLPWTAEVPKKLKIKAEEILKKKY